jgi:phosphate transport system substrate-binding protein
MEPSRTMQRVFTAVLVAAALGCSGQPESGAPVVTLTGEGATFPAPLYERWTAKYGDNVPGVTIEYRATGSGAGIKAIMSGKGDFAGSEASLTEE